MARLNYRECHLRDDDAQAYHDVYAAGYYAAQWRQLEQPWLAGLFGELRATGSRTMLDIACGQGRISILGAKYFDRVLGIDFSPQMLARAQQAADADAALAAAELRFEIGDVGTYSSDTPFDLVTAFRFFLNAEDNLRIEGLRCVRRNLTPNGTLVASVQCSGTSPLAWFYGASGAARRLLRKPISSVRNALSLSELTTMFAGEGFQVFNAHRYSLLPRIGRLTETLAERHLARIERLGKIVPGLNLLSQAYIVCARPC